MKNQKGITLIALVITIIIMLILVAVTVSYSIKSGLLTKAQKGKENYKFQEEEDKIGQIRLSYKVDKETNNTNKSLKEYLENELSKEAQISEEENNITIKFGDKGEIHKIPNEKEKSLAGTYYMYYPEYYNSIKFVLNEDGTIGGNFSENYGDYTKNWKWIKNENNSIKITWEYYESVDWEKREYILYIFNVSNGKVLAGDFGVIFFSSIDIINSFTYLREGDYTNDVTISSTMIDGYKFGMWTDSDGTVPYFTDGDYVINGRGDIYHMNGQNKFEEFEYKGN